MQLEGAVDMLININVFETLVQPVGDRHLAWYHLPGGPTTTAIATGFISGNDDTQAWVLIHSGSGFWTFLGEEAKELLELGWSHTPLVVTP